MIKFPFSLCVVFLFLYSRIIIFMFVQNDIVRMCFVYAFINVFDVVSFWLT